MTTIEQAFIECVLADLAYVDTLRTGMDLGQRQTQFARRITQPLAEQFADRFEILSVKSDPVSDYQGLVFKDIKTGDLYLANRGTESPTDTGLADLDLALGSGVASKQSAAMVNWWLDISSTQGTQIRQVNADGPNLVPFLPGTPKLATGQIAAEVGAAVASGKLHVVGHSLGGHLSTVFTSLFADQVAHASTFNGAGVFSVGAIAGIVAGVTIGHPINQLAQAIGRTVHLPDRAKMDNFFAMNGINLTTNAATFTQLGQRIEVFNEETAPLPVGNHFLYKQTDSLALANAMQKLDPSLTLAKFTLLAQSASPDNKFVVDESSLEKLLDALRRPLLGTSVSTTPSGDDGGDWEDNVMPQSRIDYHQNLKNLQDAEIFKTLAGKLTLSLADASLATQAKTDFGAFLSLNALSPVVISTTDATALAALKTANATLAQDWDADNNARLYGDTGKDFAFSDNWYTDRAALLHTIIARNTTDTSQSVISTPSAPADRGLQLEWYGADPLPGEVLPRLATLTAVRPGFRGTDFQKIAFGNDEANTLAGTDNKLGDHLYGGGGADTLDGKGGNDGADGGQGNDTLTLSDSDAIDLVAINVHPVCRKGLFSCENIRVKAKLACFQRQKHREILKTAHAHSMRRAGHKWLGRRMDAVQPTSMGAQA